MPLNLWWTSYSAGMFDAFWKYIHAYDEMKRDPVKKSLPWRHNERDGVSNDQAHDCLLNHLFKVQIKESIKAPRHWPLWGEFTDGRLITLTKGQ